jgi:DNA-binding CsgD family transcriptional regulator
MGKRVDAGRLLAINGRLGDAAVDPTIWPELLHQISAAAGAAGAALLQSDVRTSDIPRSAGADEVMNSYFANRWHTQDVRAERGVPLLLRGEKVIVDQDIVTPEEMRRLGFYTENLAPFGFQWSAAIGFWSGSALWGLSIQRTTQEGPFEESDKETLAALSHRLTEIATLSKAVGRAVLSGVNNAFYRMQQPALALDRFGCVLDVNEAAAELFDDEIRVNNSRLVVHDSGAQHDINALSDQLRATLDMAPLSAGPIVVRRRERGPIIIHVLPVDGAARSPFLGARVLLVLRDTDKVRVPQGDLLRRAFDLSAAEIRLATRIGVGIALEEAANQLGIARETARTQLKGIFAKTGTHRQSELVALISRL